MPGIGRDPLKKIAPDPQILLKLLHCWRDEAVKARQTIQRIAVAFEAGRDGFWLARWLRSHGIEAHVIHPTSIPVSREHRRAKTDRLDIAQLKRAFLGWLRGEREHLGTAVHNAFSRANYYSERTGSVACFPDEYGSRLRIIMSVHRPAVSSGIS